MLDHKVTAEKFLGFLRGGDEKCESSLRNLREELQRDGFSLADIGTSEEELEELMVKGSKIDAQKWLGHLREGDDQYKSWLVYLRTAVERGGFALVDIGTDEQELETLRINGCKITAQKWLGYLRAGGQFYESFLGYLREEVLLGGFTLSDIGTSEEELEELRVKKNAPKTSRRLLEDFRGRRMIDMP